MTKFLSYELQQKSFSWLTLAKTGDLNLQNFTRIGLLRSEEKSRGVDQSSFKLVRTH